MQKQLTEVLMNLIASETCGTEAKDLTKETLPDSFWESLYRASKSHDMAHIVGAALDKQGVNLPAEIAQKFRKQQMLAVYRYQQIQFELAEICRVLEEARIPFVPLKGAVIRSYYPQPWMRTSCDIDVLVQEENLDRAVAALCGGLSYRAEEKRNFHDVSLYSPSGIHVELHFNLREGIESMDAVLDRVWEHTRSVCESEYHSEMSGEFFFFHQIAHMAYHFLSGGCGIKPFLDLCLLHRAIAVDEAKLGELCDACNLREFYGHALELMSFWFEDGEENDLLLQMQSYILGGGVYGTKENKVLVHQNKKGGKIGYAFSRIFLKYSQLKRLFPILEKHKWLFPIFQVVRWFQIIFDGRFRSSMRELRINQSVSPEQAEQTARFLSNIGL